MRDDEYPLGAMLARRLARQEQVDKCWMPPQKIVDITNWFDLAKRSIIKSITTWQPLPDIIMYPHDAAGKALNMPWSSHDKSVMHHDHPYFTYWCDFCTWATNSGLSITFVPSDTGWKLAIKPL